MPAARSRDSESAGPPSRLAEGPPPQEATGLPLMAVMEIQRTLGSLTQSVENLRETQRSMQAELTTVCQKVNTAQTIVWIVGVGIMGVVAIVGWLVNNAIAILPSLLAPK